MAEVKFHVLNSGMDYASNLGGVHVCMCDGIKVCFDDDARVCSIGFIHIEA